MQGCIACTNDGSCETSYYMFVDAYNKLVISKNLQNALLNSEYVIYSRGAGIPSKDFFNYLDAITPQTIIEHDFNFLILLDDLTVIYISSYKIGNDLDNYFSKLTDIVNVKHALTWDFKIFVVTTDNVIYYDHKRKNPYLESFKFDKNVKVITHMTNKLYILYDDNGVDAYGMYGMNAINFLLEIIPKSTNLILDMHTNYGFLLLLYSDNNLVLKTNEEIFIESEDPEIISTLTTLYETDDIMYMLICNHESTYIVTILKNIKIISCEVFCQDDCISGIYLIYPSQNRSTLPFLDDSMKDYVLKILETSNCKYALFRDGVCIVILQDNSFKIIDSGYYEYFKEVDDIFPNLNDTYKTCELFTRGSYI